MALAGGADGGISGGGGESGQCDDGADNDRDGLFDCTDPDCIGDPTCGEAGQCGDGADNDRDGLFDCDDPDCARDPVCLDGGAPSQPDAADESDESDESDETGGTNSDHGEDGHHEDTDSATEQYHPDGYAGARMHGPDTNNLVENCMTCHGDDLRGMSGPFPESNVNCDDCHRGHEAWRSNCTYCHGGEETDDGAPPRELNAEAGAPESTYSFRVHTAHVTTTDMKVAFDCTECHVQPENIFSFGHALVGDTTPDLAEVEFTGGINPDGSWDTALGTCSNLYCHGNGQDDNGNVTEDDAPPTCNECHAYLDSSSMDWFGMSGVHEQHLRIRDATCSMCHYQTMGDPDCSDGAGCITDVSLHINRINEVVFQPSLEPYMEYEPTTRSCSAGGSSCHGPRNWDHSHGGGPPMMPVAK